MFEDAEFQHAYSVMHDWYLGACRRDPTAADRYADCLRILCSGKAGAVTDAWTRYFDYGQDTPLRKAAERAINKHGDDVTLADIQTEFASGR